MARQLDAFPGDEAKQAVEGVYTPPDIEESIADRDALQQITNSPQYRQFASMGLAERVLNGEIGVRDTARLLGWPASKVSQYVHGYKFELEQRQQADEWEVGDVEADELGLHLSLHEDNIDELVRCFVLFRSKNFLLPNNAPYFTPEFQQRWVAGILLTVISGDRLTILSPPRHGKTELLAHLGAWLLLRNPNFRILIVGGNENIASQTLSMIKDHLEYNESIAEKFIPPDQTIKPKPRSGLPWNSEKFTVATRTSVGLKSPSCAAIGRGGKILSRDADLIITDDIEDNDSVASPTTREATKSWWSSDLATRKEEHTAWVNIGSRQHMDDIHGWLLKSPSWKKIVEQAHDPSCRLPHHGPSQPDDETTPASKPESQFIPEDHPRDCPICTAHKTCVLFPEVRTFRYLMEQLKDVRNAKFEMVYQNSPHTTGIEVFEREKIEQSYNYSRVVGDLTQVPRDPDTGYRYTELVGGLDPSGTGYQAAFLWAYNRYNRKRYMVDLENEEGGGIAKARQTVINWFSKFNLRHWVIEENLYHGGIVDDEALKDFCRRNGIKLEAFNTYHHNKWDPKIGVSALAPLFPSFIDLPYGDAPSKAKIDEYKEQLVNFTDAITNRNSRRRLYRSDLVMASWFPETVIRRIDREVEVESQKIHFSHTIDYPEVLLGDMYEGILQ